jgi:hypothetical protein
VPIAEDVKAERLRYSPSGLVNEFSEVGIAPIQHLCTYRAEIDLLGVLRDFLIIPSGCSLHYGSSWADRTGAMGRSSEAAERTSTWQDATNRAAFRQAR